MSSVIAGFGSAKPEMFGQMLPILVLTLAASTAGAILGIHPDRAAAGNLRADEHGTGDECDGGLSHEYAHLTGNY